MKKVLLVLMVSMLFGTTLVKPVHATTGDLDLSKIDELTTDAIADGVFPGATVLVKHGDKVLYHESFGHAQLFDMGTKLDSPIETTNDTVYDLASVTKVMATTQALMMLTYQGKVDVDAKVATYMPDFAQNGKEDVTVRDLLTHTSGLTPWKPTFLYVDTRADEKDYVNALPLEYETGSAMKYSDFSFMALAFMVEEITGKGIEEYLEEELYGPLGLTSTMYTPLNFGMDANKIAATSWGNPYEWRMSNQRDYPNVGYDTTEDQAAFDAFTGWREFTLIGHVNDGNAGMANEGIAGHAGLFSTAQDLSVIGDVLLNGGTVNGKTFYDQATIDLYTTKDETRFNRGLGWQVSGKSETSGYVGKYASDNVFSHAGFTGTQVIFDSEKDLQVIILTNKQNLGVINENGSYRSPYKYSREVMNLVYETLEEENTVVDKSELLAKVNEIDVTDYSEYTDESVAALRAVVTGAKAVLEDNNATEEMVNKQLELIEEAVGNLVKKDVPVVETVKTDKLEAAITKAEEINRTKYTKESLVSLDKALTEAKTVLAKVNNNVSRSAADQKEVDDATAALELAINNLKEAKGSVETGIVNNPTIYLGLMALSLLGLTALYSRKKKVQ